VSDAPGLDELLAEREITRALVRFARAMDERDWETVRGLMFDDATAELGAGPLEGSAAIAESIRGYLDACGPTQHLLGNVLVEVDLAAGTAESRAYVSDVHLGKGSRRELTFSTLGDYRDSWEHDGERWRIRHRTKLNRGVLGSMDVFLGG
jgi:hypothetical protein